MAILFTIYDVTSVNTGYDNNELIIRSKALKPWLRVYLCVIAI